MENNYETRENSRPTQFHESDGKIVVVSGDSEIIGEWLSESETNLFKQISAI